jgi:hypothetical protein
MGSFHERNKRSPALKDRRLPLSHDEQVRRFPFGETFGKGFVDGLYFNKTTVDGQKLYGYQNKSGKYVWIQPHGAGTVQPKWWR